MSRFRIPAIALAVVSVLALGVTMVPSAQSQIRANPSFQPVGVSSSGSGSTAWFHDPATGRAIACHMAAGAIQCQSAKLPQEGS
ncbi:hypothetical protein [Pseudorhodoferax sp. Leaf274]|uniref:hypothetical protein n=1 Tax=Pseudorhodoferax sp. Leaf274 TaxID=1736318 RepID=UPI000702D3DB|nr:hypothetical protein [Pseudorhodoferax sp. Leaf274]KQP49299.1 hypothetical protein ASF44_01410 [Pseudorhodoferax sp. Leaf274]